MIKEDYVSYEVAKLLKEKGFDEECGYFLPTHQMAMKWLREEKSLTFIISPQWAEGDMRNPCRWYWEIRGLKDIDTDVYSQPLCDSYTKAVEAALKYSLENLI